MDEWIRGYFVEEEQYVCLFCGEAFEKGIIFPEDGVLYEAEKFTKRHLEQAHGSVLSGLLGMGKKETGLTDTQRTLLELFAAGHSDAEIAAKVGGSTSTIRNHRFTLRGKEKQAKVFLAIMSLLEGLPPQRGRAVGAGPVEFPHKAQKRKEALQEVGKLFRSGRQYSEQEVNELLGEVYIDHVLVRRLLIEDGTLEREADGSAYWKKGASEMDKRAELKWEYKNSRRPVGVYLIKCLANGKIFVDRSTNLTGMLNRRRFELKQGISNNKQLLADWKQYGEEQFVFEVLEEVKPSSEGMQDLEVEGELAQELEAKWLEKLQPYGDKGYNKR